MNDLSINDLGINDLDSGELGFADPVFESQAAFRAVLDAFARPGEIKRCGEALSPPRGLSRAAAAAVLTLVDFETSLWVSPFFPHADGVARYLKFHTGASAATAPETAAFALIDACAETFSLASFARGALAYPDRSTTLVVQVAALEGGPVLSLTGPGARSRRRLAPQSLPDDFLAQWAANHAGFPLGVDLLLCADAQALALPRSARLEGSA